jgi:hypothetical protein
MADSTNRWCLSGSLGGWQRERERARHGEGERGVARALLLSLVGLEHGSPDETT